jgi:hypothetical protein
MAKRKSTIYVDEEVLRAARVYAARTDSRDSDVVESALRRFLGLELLDRGPDMAEHDAYDIAYSELRAARAEDSRQAE